MLVGSVEAGEAFFGGKLKRLYVSKRRKLQGRDAAGETPVAGI